MSRLEQRWRAQRSVIIIVNCRIPWTNRDLNVYCAFGTSLKACLLQCLFSLAPVLQLLMAGARCESLCARFSTLTHLIALASLVQATIWIVDFVYLHCCTAWRAVFGLSSISATKDMKLSQQTRWI